MSVKYRVSLKYCVAVFVFAVIVNVFVYPVEVVRARESEELCVIMEVIDKKYKASEAISGYYEFSKENWDTFLDTGLKVAEVTEDVQKKFGRPGNGQYQKYMEDMRVAGVKMGDVAKNRRDEEGSIEEVQWQVRLMRNSCANCHRLLNIHIYPNLYKTKKHKRTGGIHDSEEKWGKPDEKE